MLDGRKRNIARALVASSFAITLAGVGLTTSPVVATPTPETVKAKVEKLYQQAEAASEQLNNATAQASDATAALSALNEGYSRESKRLEDMRQQVAAIVVSQYQGESLTAAAQVALSPDPSQFIQGMNVMSGISTQQTELMNEYQIQFDRLAQHRKAVQAESKTLSAAQAKVAEQHKKIAAATSEAERQLASLQAPQRAVVVRAIAGPEIAPASVNVPEVSGMAAVAVRYALAQVGKRYVYGASGPNAFDCSGLTMAAWGAAGVGLSHYSGAQWREGTHVSESELKPGDLVFYYRGLSHVGMYIGNGMVVNALNPSSGVRISSLHSMPYMGAVRVG